MDSLFRHVAALDAGRAGQGVVYAEELCLLVLFAAAESG